MKFKLVEKYQGGNKSIVDYLSAIRFLNNIIQLPADHLCGILWENTTAKVYEEIRHQYPRDYNIVARTKSAIFRRFRDCGITVENEKQIEQAYKSKCNSLSSMGEKKKDSSKVSDEGVKSGRVGKKKHNKDKQRSDNSKGTAAPKVKTSDKSEKQVS